MLTRKQAKEAKDSVIAALTQPELEANQFAIGITVPSNGGGYKVAVRVPSDSEKMKVRTKIGEIGIDHEHVDYGVIGAVRDLVPPPMPAERAHKLAIGMSISHVQ